MNGTTEGGIKVNISIPWVMVITAAVALLFMFKDVQDMKANMIKAERIAALEAEVKNLTAANAKQDQTHSAMWQAIGRKADK
jgi:hypothetical protein